MAQTPTPTPPPPRRSATTFLAWVWAGLLIGGGAAFLAANLGLLDALAPLEPLLAIAVAILSLPFIARWLVHRDEWWAALTAWVFISMAILILVLWFDLPYGQILGMTALVLMAAPFGAAWVARRTRWWAIITFYALLAFAALLGLTIFNVSQATLAAFALLATAAPFWVAYTADRQRWWPLLPAGALSVIAVAILTISTLLQPLSGGPFYVVLNFALAAVCVALWLTVRRLDWALWLATGFVLAAVLSIWFPSSANWAIVALTLGVYIVYKQIEAAQQHRAYQQQAQMPPHQAQTPPPAQATAQPQTPAQPPAGSPPPRPAPPPVSPPPAPPQPPAGLRADQEATTAHQARRETGADTPSKPIVEFRPLDPFKARREQAQKEENGGEDDE